MEDEKQNNEGLSQEGIMSFISGAGFNPLEMVDKIGEFKKMIPKLKSLIPMAEKYEKTLGLSEEQKLAYVLIPVGEEVLIFGWVIAQDENGNTKIVDEKKFFFKGVEEIEKILSLIPG